MFSDNCYSRHPHTFWVSEFPLARAFPLPHFLKDDYPIPDSVIEGERTKYRLRQREIEPNWLPTWAFAPDEPAPLVSPPSVPSPSIPASEPELPPSPLSSFSPTVQEYMKNNNSVTPLADDFYKKHPIVNTPGMDEVLSGILGPLAAPSGPTLPAPNLADHWIFHPAIRGISLLTRDTRPDPVNGPKWNVVVGLDFANVLQVTRAAKTGPQALSVDDIRALQPCLPQLTNKLTRRMVIVKGPHAGKLVRRCGIMMPKPVTDILVLEVQMNCRTADVPVKGPRGEAEHILLIPVDELCVYPEEITDTARNRKVATDLAKRTPAEYERGDTIVPTKWLLACTS